MNLRGMLRVVGKTEAIKSDPPFATLVEEDNSIFSLKVYQTGLPQSPEEEEFVGTLLIFANGETKLVEHRSED